LRLGHCESRRSPYIGIDYSTALIDLAVEYNSRENVRFREKIDSDYSAEQEEYGKAQLFGIFEQSGLQQISIHP
jgi:hypothetical protein